MEFPEEPAVEVTCTLCGILHAPENLFAPHPVCPTCRAARTAEPEE